tara:strand:- start:3760 stop:4095 length:336 start_codon:yes stop_codon:yes gene_type:complete
MDMWKKWLNKEQSADVAKKRLSHISKAPSIPPERVYQDEDEELPALDPACLPLAIQTAEPESYEEVKQKILEAWPEATQDSEQDAQTQDARVAEQVSFAQVGAENDILPKK